MCRTKCNLLTVKYGCTVSVIIDKLVAREAWNMFYDKLFSKLFKCVLLYIDYVTDVIVCVLGFCLAKINVLEVFLP